MCNNDLDWEGMRDKVIEVIPHKLWFQTGQDFKLFKLKLW